MDDTTQAAEQETSEAQPFDPANLQPGELAPFDVSSEPTLHGDQLSEVAKGALTELVRLCSKADSAARRFEVEQAWEARLFERGYQHLLPRAGGGWTMPGENTRWGPLAIADEQSLYSTNIYASHGDIITSALARDVPRVQFFPEDSNAAPDTTAAEEANNYKWIWVKNNDIRARMVEVAKYFWTDDRVLLYTRSVADGQQFGFEDISDESPVTPENEMQPEEQELQQPQPRKARIREVTEVFGKLESKVPLTAQELSHMPFVQLYREMDVSMVRAMFPWIATKVKPGGCGIGEIELDKIARVNTKLALMGAYVTGDSQKRDTTIQYTWMRPAMFMDDLAKTARTELFELFPDGALVVCAGSELAFARNESMNDHIEVMHPFPGNGQNRRALGTSTLPVQKRLNNWLDLMNDYYVKTVPHKYYDSEAFDINMIKSQSNVPGAAHSFLRQPGVPADQLIFVEPTPQHQPTLPDMVKWFVNGLPETLDGALPSLFGAPSNTDTVGGIAIQRDQALARVGTPWNAIQSGFCGAARQAAQCCARVQEGSIGDTVPGKGAVVIEVANLKGNVLCYPEADTSFPESWTQREQRFTQLVEMASNNPVVAKLLMEPKNMKAAKDAIRLKDFVVPGADSVDKQQGEIEVLLKSGPVPNPQKVQAEQQLSQITQQKQAEEATGVQQDPQAERMFQQAQQMLSQIPEQVSTIPVMQDASEDHQTEGATCFDWMNSQEGRRYKNGSPEQRAGWENVHLHWNEHNEMASKLSAQQPPQQPVKANLSIPVDKLPPAEAAAALQKEGIPADPKDFQEQQMMSAAKEAFKAQTAPNKETPINA